MMVGALIYLTISSAAELLSTLAMPRDKAHKGVIKGERQYGLAGRGASLYG